MRNQPVTKQVDTFIAMAHSIFNAASIYEVIVLENRQSAEDFLNRVYKNPDKKLVKEYLDLVERVKQQAVLLGCLRSFSTFPSVCKTC